MLSTDELVPGPRPLLYPLVDTLVDTVFLFPVSQKMMLEIADRMPQVPPLRLASARSRPPCNAGELQLLDWLFDLD